MDLYSHHSCPTLESWLDSSKNYPRYEQRDFPRTNDNWDIVNIMYPSSTILPGLHIKP